ncbi:MAG: MutS family DNA mismatch repair protein [Polyangiaceae bacterium]
MNAREGYVRGRDARAKDKASFEARATAVSTVRLVVAALVLAGIVGLVWFGLPGSTWIAIGVLVAGFVGLVVLHGRIFADKERAHAALRFHERGIARLDGAWKSFPQTGARYRDTPETSSMAYVDDLDVFGPSSLFQRVDMTETRFGEKHLAALFTTRQGEGFPGGIRDRQAAVRELAPKLDFRERLASAGAVLGADKPDPTPFVEFAEGAMPFSASVRLRIVSVVFPLVSLVLLFGAPSFGISRLWMIVWASLGISMLGGARAEMSAIAQAVSVREQLLSRYAGMFAVLESETFESERLRALASVLRTSGQAATVEMGRLARVLSFLEARNNEVFRVFIGPILLWDVHCVFALDAWRKRVGSSVRGWFEALGEIEALASLASYAFEEPTATYPEFVDEAAYECEGLVHPLLPEGTRVANDVRLFGPGSALIVSGSNMSGKSTMLRAMGVSSVMALAGAPVLAKRLRLGPLTVATSMRIKDSLEHGVSHFYAELQKLKQVVQMARDGKAVFFLLDEILHGTNSRERLIGARAVIRELLTHGALGAVSTHDLAMGDLEESLPGKVKNVHFEEQVNGDVMTFDYKLREGVVQSSNALRLMRMVGIDVVPLDGA